MKDRYLDCFTESRRPTMSSVEVFNEFEAKVSTYQERHGLTDFEAVLGLAICWRFGTDWNSNGKLFSQHALRNHFDIKMEEKVVKVDGEEEMLSANDLLQRIFGKNRNPVTFSQEINSPDFNVAIIPFAAGYAKELLMIRSDEDGLGYVTELGVKPEESSGDWNEEKITKVADLVEYLLHTGIVGRVRNPSRK